MMMVYTLGLDKIKSKIKSKFAYSVKIIKKVEVVFSGGNGGNGGM